MPDCLKISVSVYFCWNNSANQNWKEHHDFMEDKGLKGEVMPVLRLALAGGLQGTTGISHDGLLGKKVVTTG